MTIGIILGIMGILATVCVGIWGAYIIIRKRYPGEITMVTDECIGLFDTIVKNFPELAVLYKEEPVSQGLVLLKGTFLNSGKKDITQEMVEDKMALDVPDGFKWLAAKIVGSSANVQASVQVETDSLTFSTGLFRCHEYFKFEVLAEVPVSEEGKSIERKLKTSISPSHRIADTARIAVVSLPGESYTKQKLRKRLIMFGTMLIVGIVLCSATIMIEPGKVLRFDLPQENGVFAEVKVTPLNDGMVRIRSKTGNIDEKVEVTAFFERSDIRAKVVRESRP